MTKANRIGFVDKTGKFKPIDKAFKEVIDKAVMSVSTGTGDYNSEMLDVLRQLGGSGVRVDYGNDITRSLDSMVRQNVLWGAKQTAKEYEHIIGDELGCNGIEIDWHSNPRPRHEFMQGKQFILGKARTVNGIYFESADKALEALDDYGCLHFETRIICGVSEPAYSPEELRRLNAENNRLIEIDGVSKKGYEWKQTMRRLERAGKETKLKRETFKAAGNNTEARNQSQRLKTIEEKYQLIADKTGIKAQYERMAIVKGKSVDNYKNRGIIKEKEVEYGIPYGESSVNANMNVINSEQYGNKFNITDNAEVNVAMGKCARKSIDHRNGTKFEDMYIINAQNGDLLGSQLDMQVESGIAYNESILNALEKARQENIPIIALHNHPEGLPPSVDDFNKAFDNNYLFGVACGHNGQVYVYKKPLRRINAPEDIHNEIALRYSMGLDVDRAYTEVYKEIGLKYEIMKGD